MSHQTAVHPLPPIPLDGYHKRAVGSDGIYVVTANTSGSGTSGIRIVTNGISDQGLYVLNGIYAPGTRHYGLWIEDYDNVANTTGAGIQFSRVGDSTGVGNSITITDNLSVASGLNTSTYMTWNVNNQTSGNLFSVFQQTTPFSGDMFHASFGSASGTFTGKFENYLNGGTTEFKVDSSGDVTAHGTLGVTGASTLTGALTANGGINSNAGMVFGGTINTAATANLANGVGIQNTGTMAYVDTSSAGGTVANFYGLRFGSPTFSASAATTYTNAALLYLDTPTAGTNATLSNKWSLITQGAIDDLGSLTVAGGATFTGGTVNINANSSNTQNTNINTLGTGTVTVGNSSNTGKTTIANMAAATVGNDYVCATTAGILSIDTTTCGASSRRFKQDINPLLGGLDKVMRLQPVSFYYKPSYDPKDKAQHIGFIAEDVEKVEPRLVAHDKKGEPNGVDYAKMSALLTKAVQDQQREIAVLQAEVNELRRTH